MDRAYSLLHIKAVDAARRAFSGMATTPDVDRQGHSVNPKGVRYKNPLPLLFHHDQKRPVGTVTFQKATDEGIPFEGLIPHVEDAGTVKDRVDEAWHSVKAGLISGVSIGWLPVDDPTAIEILPNGVVRLNKIEVMELSLVTVPANAKATIRLVKSLDLAASGLHAPGVTGTTIRQRAAKGARPMTIPEQIAGLEAKRAANLARMTEIQTKATDAGVTKDESEKEEFTTLRMEIKSIDEELVDLRDMEKLALVKATPITTATATSLAASDLRGGNSGHVIQVKANVPKGTAFARMCMALAAGGGDSYQTIQYAKQWKDSTPEVEEMVQFMWRSKAAVAVGTTTDSTWAGPLVVTTPINEFLEMLRPKTLIGRIPGFRNVPFNVSLPAQTTGGTYSWVGQNKPKPVTKADYSTVTVGFSKAAGIIVISEELARLSTPSAEGLVRDEMIAGMGQFLDGQLVDPAIAAVTGVNPASITNGAATIASSGVTGSAAKIDLSSRVGVFVAANIPVSESVWLMNESNAFGIGLSVNSLGQPLFPGFNGTDGGNLMGVPVVISNNVGARVILVHAPSILVADEGGVRIDVSREATIQLESAPTDTVDATTVYQSLWQRNLIGLKAERFISWVRARSAAVTYITTASPYNGT